MLEYFFGGVYIVFIFIIFVQLNISPLIYVISFVDKIFIAVVVVLAFLFTLTLRRMKYIKKERKKMKKMTKENVLFMMFTRRRFGQAMKEKTSNHVYLSKLSNYFFKRKTLNVYACTVGSKII